MLKLVELVDSQRRLSMLVVLVQYLLLLELEEQVHTILEDLDKVLHPHLVHSCQQLEEMVLTNPINTQEDLEVLELVEMLICTVVAVPHTVE